MKKSKPIKRPVMRNINGKRVPMDARVKDNRREFGTDGVTCEQVHKKYAPPSPYKAKSYVNGGDAEGNG